MNAPARRAGMLVPLFSFPSSSSWGIGDIGDVAPMAAWLEGAGQRLLQLLPLNEMAAGQQSPYSAMSAMAIDPIFIRLQDVPEFGAGGGESSLGADDREILKAVRGSPRVEYAAVRKLKLAALTAAFERFHRDEWERGTVRAAVLAAFVSDQRWWLDDYALYRALHARDDGLPWTGWPAALSRRDPDAMENARRELWKRILLFQYLQWLADAQWRAARAAARARGVALFGDLPFMVDLDSADVWSRQNQFRLDVSVGAPPDAFSAEGQDWGMPACDWPAMAADGFAWLRARARRSADLFDGCRVDHLVGFYRTYGRPRAGGAPFFSPSDEGEQVRLGEEVLGVLAEPAVEIVAEDLGIIPDYVRASLGRLGVPGFRVLRWEREWHSPGQPFRNPPSYPALSVATSGTHDTEPMAVWWERAPEEERRQVSGLPIVQKLTAGEGLLGAPYDPTVRDALLEALFASGSAILLNVIQDVFGWRDRINEPATIDDRNWTFRLPWPSDRLGEIAEARERQQRLREWSQKYGRV
jgi:4-alpha-glucanotransferase